MKTKYIKKQCKECNQEFNALLVEVKRGNAKFCSRSCSAHHRNNSIIPVKLTCNFCKKDYTSKNRNSKYCCNSCGIKARNLRSGESKNIRNALKREVIKFLTYDEFKCFICGWKEESCDIHHIIPKRSQGKNTPDNLSVLCPNHHRLADKNKLDNLPTVSDRYRTISSSQDNILESWAL